MKTEIIAISNHKGGVGKTETAVNLACAIQRADMKVLLIDADAQNNATLHFGISQKSLAEKGIPTLAEDLRNVIECRAKGISYVYDNRSMIHTDEGVDLIAGSEDLTDVEEEMLAVKDPVSLVSEYLASMKGKYDYIIIDEHPSLGVLFRSILQAATKVNIPIVPEQYAAQGMLQMIKSIRKTDRKIPISMEFCRVSTNNSDAKQWVEMVVRNYGKIVKIHKTYIPERASIRKAKDYGQSILNYEPNGVGAKKYFALAEEIIGKPISQTQKIDLRPDEIDVDPAYEKESSEILIEDIRENGIKERLAVRKKQNGRYDLVHGYRRFNAARKSGMEIIPCEIIKIAKNDIPVYRHQKNN